MKNHHTKRNYYTDQFALFAFCYTTTSVSFPGTAGTMRASAAKASCPCVSTCQRLWSTPDFVVSPSPCATQHMMSLIKSLTTRFDSSCKRNAEIMEGSWHGFNQFNPVKLIPVSLDLPRFPEPQLQHPMVQLSDNLTQWQQQPCTMLGNDSAMTRQCSMLLSLHNLSNFQVLEGATVLKATSW